MKAIFLLAALAAQSASAALMVTIDYGTVVSTAPASISVGFGARDGTPPYVIWSTTATTVGEPLSVPVDKLAALSAELTMTDAGPGFFMAMIGGASQSFAVAKLFENGAVSGTNSEAAGAVVTSAITPLGSGLAGYALESLTLELGPWTPHVNGIGHVSGWDGHLVARLYGSVAVPESSAVYVALAGLLILVTRFRIWNYYRGNKRR